MENRIFYAYLEYQKDNKLNIWKSLCRLPIHIIVIFIALVISGIVVVVVVASLFNNSALVYRGLISETIMCILMYIFSEKHLIKFSKINYDKYCDYCRKLREWLKYFSIKNYEDVYQLLEKIKLQINEIKAESEKRKNHFDKLLQTLVIPIILAMITTIITKQDDMSEMIKLVTVILTSFIIIYVAIISLKNVVLFPKKRRLEQLQCFANDLDGILYCIKKDKEKPLSKTNVSKCCHKTKH